MQQVLKKVPKNLLQNTALLQFSPKEGSEFKGQCTLNTHSSTSLKHKAKKKYKYKLNKLEMQSIVLVHVHKWWSVGQTDTLSAPLQKYEQQRNA